MNFKGTLAPERRMVLPMFFKQQRPTPRPRGVPVVEIGRRFGPTERLHITCGGQLQLSTGNGPPRNFGILMMRPVRASGSAGGCRILRDALPEGGFVYSKS